MKSTVVKFQPYPTLMPTGYAVGFHVVKDRAAFYIDTVVPFDEVGGMTELEIAAAGWDKVKVDAWNKADAINSAAPVYGLVVEGAELVMPATEVTEEAAPQEGTV